LLEPKRLNPHHEAIRRRKSALCRFGRVSVSSFSPKGMKDATKMLRAFQSCRVAHREARHGASSWLIQG